MLNWPHNPAIYEINTWVWLHDLSQRYRRPVTLGDVPDDEWDAIAEYALDVVWLMGVWERSPRGAAIAREHPGLQAEYHRALPDFSPDDVIGSPYSVHRYVVDARLGGVEGLAAARQALAERGIRLILDFVPNHVAVDHPWTIERPEYFVPGTEDDLKNAPDDFFTAGGFIYAHGRDPYFPPWTDTAQLNAFNPELRRAMIDTLIAIGDQCDGVRVDMAMLMVKRIFAGTWGDRAGAAPAQEFWWEVLHAVRRTHPDLLFVAEVYWDMEWELQQQGFDYCYDKRLYDRLTHEAPSAVYSHLSAAPEYQGRLVRFIENHDEPRAASTFAPQQQRAAAMLVATLPGARLFHEGQFEGCRVKVPVQLGRRPEESNDSALRAFYRSLLQTISQPVFHAGAWQFCERYGWPDNQSFRNVGAWCWQYDADRWLAVVNWSDQPAQAMIRLPWADLAGESWRLVDPLNGDVFARSGSDLVDAGLYVALNSFGLHLLTFEQA